MINRNWNGWGGQRVKDWVNLWNTMLISNNNYNECLVIKYKIIIENPKHGIPGNYEIPLMSETLTSNDSQRPCANKIR